MFFKLVIALMVFFLSNISSIRAYSTKNSISIDEDQTSQLKETPWLVSIRINGVHYCSGAIVSNSWVVTSSQCIFNIQEMIPMVTIQTCDLNIYIVTETSLHSLHSLMNSTWPKLGIAMIRIFGTFSSDGPCYVEHLSVSRYWQTPSSEKEFSIASWEQNVVGNKITFDSKTSRWSPQKTQDCYQYYPLNSDLLHSENIFCAVLNENNLKNSSCILGDLGSPVVSYSYLTGIKSQKMDCELFPHSRSLFTNVKLYADWIESKINSDY